MWYNLDNDVQGASVLTAFYFVEFFKFIQDIFKGIKKLFLSIFSSKQKKPGSVSLNRFDENPIVTPRQDNEWECWQTFNPGVVLLNNKIHFLYRAMGDDGVSRLGYAISSDGLTIDKRLSYPVYSHDNGGSFLNVYSFLSGGSFKGAEDPRLVRVSDEDEIHLIYTACEDGLRVGLSSIKVEDFLNNEWNWNNPNLISPPGEIHKNWVIFPEKINGQYAIIHSINPTVQIEYRDSLDFDEDEYINSFYGGMEEDGRWDKLVRGVGPPPIKTDEGWLVLYHAMGEDKGKYKVGAKLLDLKDPSKILYRSNSPILEPEEHYENNGHKPGVVYASGAIVKDGRLLVYYGCSDSYVGVAHAPVDDFLDSLKRDSTPSLENKSLF